MHERKLVQARRVASQVASRKSQVANRAQPVRMISRASKVRPRSFAEIAALSRRSIAVGQLTAGGGGASTRANRAAPVKREPKRQAANRRRQVAADGDSLPSERNLWRTKLELELKLELSAAGFVLARELRHRHEEATQELASERASSRCVSQQAKRRVAPTHNQFGCLIFDLIPKGSRSHTFYLAGQFVQRNGRARLGRAPQRLESVCLASLACHAESDSRPRVYLISMSSPENELENLALTLRVCGEFGGSGGD